MKTNSTDIADFYRQISLLLKSGLPLPDSIKQLGINFDKADFKKVLLGIADDTSKGETLASAMKKHPDYFTEFHMQMIEAGEKSGMLPETLSEIAEISHLNLQLTSMVREISIYPVFTFWFAFVIIFLLFMIIIPEFKIILEEMFGPWYPLPALTEFVLSVGESMVKYKKVFIGIFIFYAVFFTWLYGGGLLAKRLFIWVISFLPGARQIFYSLNMARLCAMWSMLMRQKMPSSQALEITKSLIENRKISSALGRISGAISKGASLVEILEQEKSISSMIPLTVKHVPEKELPEELANLANLFRERASVATRKASVIWGISLIIFLALTVGTIIISMFLPLITVIKLLGGG